MPHELEYIVDKAVCCCDKGAAPDFFTGTSNTTVKISGCMACTKADKEPLTNIPSFGVCSVTGSACAPAPVEWKDTYKVKVKGHETLLFKSTLPCGLGGTIEFMTSGQVAVDQGDLDELMEEHGEEEDEGWGWWDTAELVPVVGSIIGIVRSAAKGDGWMAAANVGFLVLDVAGLISFGATTAVSTGLKTTAKVGTKVATRSAVKAGAKKAGARVLSKQGLKTAGQALAKKVDDMAMASGKVCVFACFPAGTPVHTASGLKNIEDIVIGELVWSYDENTGETALQVVTAVMDREVDATVQIELEGEVIETTAEHPFYTQDGWKDAADLCEKDVVQTKQGDRLGIRKVEFSYKRKKVFNFEVAGWHTYFVGVLAWLVHNAQPCLSTMILQSQMWFQNIMRGNSFNAVMNAFTESLAKSKGKYFFAELSVKFVKGGKGRIDSLIPGVAMIERKATNLAKVTVSTAKGYIDDAAKYKNAIYETAEGTVEKVTEKIYLHVDEIGDVSKEVLEHASKKGVEIIDDISKVKFP